MSGVNKVILVGNVGKDPEVKYLDNNLVVAKFPLATTEVYKKDGQRVETTEWHNIVMWRGLAEIAEKIASGEQALLAFGAQRFDLVLIDLHMPGVDGPTAVAAMRALEAKMSWPRTPIVAISADVLTETIAGAREAGCDAFLSKPIRRTDLVKAIARWSSSPSTGAPVDDDVIALWPKYLAHRRDDRTALSAALATNAWERVEHLAHNIKGTGTAYGFPMLSEIGRDLESAAKARDRSKAERALDHMTRELDRIDASMSR